MNRKAMDYHNLVGGAVAEHVDAKIKEVLENIEDINTPWKPKREITIKVVFAPNEDRDRCQIGVAVTTKLPGFKPLESGCFITRVGNTLVAIENENPQQLQLNFNQQLDVDKPQNIEHKPPLTMVNKAN